MCEFYLLFFSLLGIGEESGSENSFQITRIFWQSFGAENYILELVFWPKINNPIYICTLGLVRVVIVDT